MTAAQLLLTTGAWYDWESNEIIIGRHLHPFPLVLLHEVGHYLLGYLPQAIHLVMCIDEWWDNLFITLRLNHFLTISLP